MRPAPAPLIAVVGNVTTAPNAAAAAEELGRELAKAGFRILVYSSGPDYLEGAVVKGYAVGRGARSGGIQVRYPLHGEKPSFPEQEAHKDLFEWRPHHSPDWEISFYQSLQEAQGILLLGGGQSTLIAGLVAMGHRIGILALAGFGGRSSKIWEALRPGRDLPTADEISLMARPDWSAEVAADCVQSLGAQLQRRDEELRQRRLEELRQEAAVSRHALVALGLFVAAVLCVPIAWALEQSFTTLVWLLFVSPLLAGVAGSTIRLVFDLRQGALPLTRQSAITTAALGLVAGGVAGLLFVTAQMTVSTDLNAIQLWRLVPFGVVVGFIAGLTLDAVFRKLISADVVDLSGVEAKKGA